MSTLEIMIAFAIISLTMTAVILISFGNQKVAADTETNNEALYKAKELFEDARALSRRDFNAVTSLVQLDDIYTKTLLVSDLTPCRKEALSELVWNTEALRPQKIELRTNFTDIYGALALGGDCDANPPNGGWTVPNSLSSADFIPSGAKATDIDVLNRIVFLSARDPSAAKDDLFVFDATSAGAAPVQKGKINTGPSINAIDAFSKSDGFYYIFTANDKDSDQLQVIKVPQDFSGAPQIIAEQSLFGVDPGGSYPEGWRVYYFGDRLYILTRETAGPELHIFDVVDPSSPIEIDSFWLNRTVNAIIVREQTVNGASRRIAYLATADNNDDIVALDVTDPIDSDTFRLASLNLSGSNDARSIYLLGSTLYLGKDSSGSAPELFLVSVADLDFTSPGGGLRLMVERDMGMDINDIQVSGGYGFLATSESNKEFQVWNMANIFLPADIYNISKFNFSQKIVAIEYEDGFIYTANESNDALRIIRPAECSDNLDDDGDTKIDEADPECHVDGNANNDSSYDPEDDDEN